MSEQVKVADIETLDRLRTALARAAEAFDLAMQEAQTGIDRFSAWLEHERPEELRIQIRKAQDRVVAAKSALFNKEMIRSTADSRPSVVDERKALARAEEQLADLEQRARRCRFWSTELASKRAVYRGGMSGLRTAVDRDVPRAIALLRHLSEHLEEYARGGEERERILAAMLGTDASALPDPPPPDATERTGEEEGP